MIVDSFGRIHDYLRVSLTERCNLRCFYCMPEEGIVLRNRAEFMTAEELLKIASVFVNMGVKKIRITGGEPLVRKDFSHIISNLGKLPIELALTTNAVLIHKYIYDLKQAGVQNINVSLDSLKESKFNQISRRNYYPQIRQNIDSLLLEGFKVKVNVVLMKGINDDEIIDFIEWANQYDLQVRFIEFMPFQGNNWNLERKVSYAEIIEKVSGYYGLSKLQKLTDSKNDTCKNFIILGNYGSFGIISSITNPFCDSCNRIRLTADGKIKNCLFSQSETDLLTAVRKGANIEHIINDSIMSKKKERGGLSSFSNELVKELRNRTMVAIGG